MRTTASCRAGDDTSFEQDGHILDKAHSETDVM